MKFFLNEKYSTSLNGRARIFTVTVLLAAAYFLLSAGAAAADAPIGWAVVPGNGLESTIGGGNGNVVTATTASQLSSYAGSSDPLVILVSGTLTGSGAINVKSNKTILGQGADTTLSGVGLSLSSVSNVIIRNLRITGAVDAIATRGSHHVWIDHCDVWACGDGLIDITKESDFHTVSWTRFSNHDKTMLINSGTDQPADIGKLNTTLHHNWWDGTNQRNPRAAYGKIHVFNNLYNSNNSYCIGLHSDCRVLAERNYFMNTNAPFNQMYVTDSASPYWGHCESMDNIFINCTGSLVCDDISFNVNDYYLHDFELDAAGSIPSIVQAGAGTGAQYGVVGLMPIPGNGAVRIGSTPTLKWTKGPSATSYLLSFGTTANPPQVYSGAARTYVPGTLIEGTIYYWRVDQVTPSGIVAGDLWRFAVGEYGIIPDETSPAPDPMIWATEPYGTNPTSIAMVATTATDASGVEYMFTCTSGGGHDSGWQNSTSYTDTGLTTGSAYSYRVKARDKSINQNETGWSAARSVTLVPDTTGPVPNPMTWASVPASIGIDTITMTATTATDASGVEYYFACTSGGGHDSGWQDSTTYTDTGLTNNTIYAYRVMARDKSGDQNETGWSDQASVKTLCYECLDPLENDFNGDCRVDFIDFEVIASVWGAESCELVNLITNGDFASGLSGWNTAIAYPTLVDISWDAGTAKLARTVSSSTAPNGNYLYQVIPVVSGKEYKLDAQWKGDLTGTDRQWAEVYVGFVATGTIPPSAFGSIMYKKATYGSPNASPMPWDWDSILYSPNTNPVPPTDGLFTATDNYMVVAFNLGGRANAGTCDYSVDNISLVEAGGAPCPTIDLNDDCALDIQDLVIFAQTWLDCNREPVGECLQ